MPKVLKLVVENLGQSYGDLALFQNLSFVVGNGQALVVTGDNGSGKSTLLRTLAGLMEPARGTVTLSGLGDGEAISEHCHLVGFANALKPELTATETLVHWRDVLGGAGQGLPIAEALDRLGLAELASTRAGILSTGLKRRLALARILVAPRPLWLLDEPTAALDLSSSRMVAAMIASHLEAGGLAVIATHLDLDLAGVDTLNLDTFAMPRA
jgi:heme exporter protein A